ncbi:MAG: hypothetical protein RBR71_06845 [Gudongella sp.]|nr:hypothetical protein [Gudongella sp.]
MNYLTLLADTENNDQISINGKTGALLSTAMACEIMQMVIKQSLNKFYGLSDIQFMKFWDELQQLKVDFTILNNVLKEDLNSIYFLKDKAYLCKRVYRIGLILKSNSNSLLSTDLSIAINLAKVSLDGLVSILKNNLNLIENSTLKKELESHIEILAKEDEFHQKIMNSPDY